MSYIKNEFSEIKDDREQGYIKHNLAEMLIIVMCAILCRLDDLAGIVAFADKRARACFVNKSCTNLPRCAKKEEKAQKAQRGKNHGKCKTLRIN